jgi:2-oxoglutarate ferredoxin oxidoreductase subunit gamma
MRRSAKRLGRGRGVRKEIRLSGSGGQGLLLIGKILAEALGIVEGKNVVLSNSYGGQVRGGSSRSDILISPPDEEIDFPEVMNADILLAMTQEAADEYGGLVKADGLVILDSTFVKQIPPLPGKVIRYPFTLQTKERLGSELPANIVILAVIAREGELVEKESLIATIKKLSPGGKEEINLQALQLGYELVEGGVLQASGRS